MSDSYRPSREWLYPQRFDYVPVNELWAAVWIETPLDPGIAPPAAPVLAVRSGAVETSHPAFLSCTQRLRADGTRPAPRSIPDLLPGYLLWRARFSVPLEVLDDPAAQFTLRSADGVAIALPTPQPPPAELAPAAERLAALRVRRRAVALAAGVAVASAPVATAAADTAPGATTNGTTTTTATTATTPTTPPSTPDPSATGTGTATDATVTPTTDTTTTSTPAPTTTTLTTTTNSAPATTSTPTPPPSTTAPTETSTPVPPPSTTPGTSSTTTPPATPRPPVHNSGGSSVPASGLASAGPAAKKSKSHATKKHRTSLRCTERIAATKKAKLSKRALARLERTSTKTKCTLATARHGKAHGHHRTTTREARTGKSISGGAAARPGQIAAPLASGPTSLLNPNPAAASAWSRLSLLFARGDRPPSFLIPIYRAAGRKYHVPWPVLAAINAIETDYGRDLKTSPAGAMGWMQFMPGTWMEYGVATRDQVVPNPYDPRDAIFSAARYLAANGAHRDLRRAIFAYNHARWYVDEVLWTAADIIDHTRVKGSRTRVKLAAMQAMALALDGEPYVWGGGHGDWAISGGYDCSGFVSAVLHAAGYLRTPVTTQALPSERNILQGPGRYVTIFDRTDGGALNEDHVIIDLHGQWWESGGSDAGAGVHRIKHISASYLLTFNQILHPRGL